jgi:TRAP-type uncharacterized transport system fused permease subunit
MFAIAVGVQGYMIRKVSVPWRLLAFVAGFLLIDPGLFTDFIGVAILSVIVAIQLIKKRREDETRENIQCN